jgi:peptide/nickel transport system substrate-binding protein
MIGIVVLIIIIIAAGGFYAVSNHSSITTSVSSTTSAPSSSVTTSMASSSSLSLSSTSSTLQSTTSQSSATSTSQTTSSSSSTTSAPSSSNNTITIDDEYYPRNGFNQLGTVDLAWPLWAIYSVYQALIDVNISAEYGQDNIQFLPGLAANWTVSPDGTTYTMNLRQGINFSNGDQFNAYEVWMQMYGIYYLSGNSSSWLENYDLFNMSNVNFGPATWTLINQSGLTNPSSQALAIMTNSSWPMYVTGPYQIVFHMQAPFAWFLGTMVSFDGLIFDSQFVLDNGGFGTAAAYNTYFNQYPIPGTGPYTFGTFIMNSYVQFVQNSNYWGRSLTPAEIASNPQLDPGHAKTIYIYYKTDDVSRYVDLTTGAAQIVAIGEADWNLIQANPSEFSYLRNPSWAGETTTIPLNTADYPTNITLVRQAIVHAINYTDIIDSTMFGQGTEYVGPEYPAWSQFYDLGGAAPYSYNLTLAQQDLTEANITNMPTLTLTIPNGCQYCVSTAEIVQTDLAQIGITISVEIQNNPLENDGNYQTNVQNAQENGQMTMIPIEAPNGLTPADNWEAYVSNTSLWGNFAAYNNPVVQACVDGLTSISNITTIQGLCEKAQLQINTDAPYVWIDVNNLWYGDGSLVWNKHVIAGFLSDPIWSGQDTAPILNTITFA